MKKQLDPHKNIKDDIFYWIKEYLSSKIYTISIDKGNTTFNRKNNSDLVLRSKNIEELKSNTIHVRFNGLKNLGTYSLPLIKFYEFIVDQKKLISIREFDTTIRDKIFPLDKKKYKESTQRAKLFQINSLFKYIEENNNEMYRFNLGRTRGGKKTKSPVLQDEDDGFSYLNETELKGFIKVLDKFPFRVKNTAKPKLMTKIALYAGLRGEELASLRRDKVSVVDVKNSLIEGKFLQIYVDGKGNKERVALIRYENISKEYENYVKDAIYCENGLFFCTESNKKYTINALYQQTKRILEYAGITKGAGIHLLRRSYASYLATQNVDFAIISELLGHANEEVTQLYVRIGRDGMRPIAKEWKDF